MTNKREPDQIEERWREKYYDKVNELNAAEQKLQAAEAKLNSVENAQVGHILAERDQLRAALTLAVGALEYCKDKTEFGGMLREEYEAKAAQVYRKADETLASIRAKVGEGK